MRSAPHAALHPYAPVALCWDEPLARTVARAAPACDGPLLVVQCRTGASVRAAVETLGDGLRVMAVDRDADCIDAARSIVDPLSARCHLSVQSPRMLSFGTDVFGAALAVSGTVGAAAARDVVSSLARFVKPGGWIGLATASSATLPTWLEMISEAAWVEGADGVMDDARAAYWSARDQQEVSEAVGIDWIAHGDVAVPIETTSPEAYLAHPLVQETLSMLWRPMVGQDLIADASERLATYYRSAPVLDEFVATWHVGTVREGVLDVAEADLLDE